jgi:hypothetical protein
MRVRDQEIRDQVLGEAISVTASSHDPIPLHSGDRVAT